MQNISGHYCMGCGKPMERVVYQRGYDPSTGQPVLYEDYRCADAYGVWGYNHADKSPQSQAGGFRIR